MQKKLNKTIISFLVLIAQIILFSVLFLSDNFIDFIVQRITFPLSAFVAKMTNSVQLPLGEIFYLMIGILGFFLIFRVIRSFFYKNRETSKSIYHLLIFVNSFYFIYIFAWGVMYSSKRNCNSTKNSKRNLLYRIRQSNYCP